MPIDREELVAVTKSLIDTPSENPPGNESAVADVLVDRLTESPVAFSIDSYDVLPDRPNVVATAGHDGDPYGPHVLLTGHMDVVPAKAKHWTGDPYEMRREDGRLIGRGTSDMKAALAAKLIAAESYLSKHPDGCRVTLAFVVDEEWGGAGTKAVADRGVDADVAVVGEPTQLQVCTAQKGVTRYRIHVHGRSAHSGMPDSGRNAIRGITQLLQHIEELDTERRVTTEHPQLEPETVTVTEIEGGLAPNVVADSARITIDWRTHPQFSATPEATDARIDDLVDTVSTVCPELTFETERIVFARGAEIGATHELVRTLVSAAADAGVESKPVGFNAATDARFLIHDADVPTVLFGPGSIKSDAHTVDESIAEDDLYRTAQTYESLLERFGRST